MRWINGEWRYGGVRQYFVLARNQLDQSFRQRQNYIFLPTNCRCSSTLGSTRPILVGITIHPQEDFDSYQNRTRRNHVNEDENNHHHDDVKTMAVWLIVAYDFPSDQSTKTVRNTTINKNGNNLHPFNPLTIGMKEESRKCEPDTSLVFIRLKMTRKRWIQCILTMVFE